MVGSTLPECYSFLSWSGFVRNCKRIDTNSRYNRLSNVNEEIAGKCNQAGIHQFD